MFDVVHRLSVHRISVQCFAILLVIISWILCGDTVWGQEKTQSQRRKLVQQSTETEQENPETYGGLPFITQAGPYTVQTGANNPLDGVDIGTESAPALVDIDNDGDLDLFAGEDDGTINYFENTGSVSAATFVQRTGGSNPFNGVDVGGYAYPSVVDIDNDGDFDVFIGDEDVNLFYYKNTGSVSAATFTLQTGGSNPFNGAFSNTENKAGFVDIDNDGDFDAFVGEDSGIINYFENTGSASVPTFVQRTGGSNPFNGVDVGGYTSITFFDDGGDSDYDAYVGEAGGVINFFENTGTASVPTFTEQTGGSNPFNGVSVGSYSRPTVGDLDNDTDIDVLIGENDGAFNFYLNTELPIVVTQFVEQTGASNPLDGEDLGSFTAPAMVDIDNDGDLDVFSGESAGAIFYYENTGSASSATFTQRTGASNPFDGENVGGGSKIVFVDIDNDSDYDAFIGESDGVVNYYENTGSVGSPTFVQRTGGSNPFDGVDIGSFSPPVFGDLDNDGDFDAFVGDINGNVHYFENTGSAASPTFVERTGASNPLDGEDVGDFSTPGLYDNDYDGDLDVFIGGGTGVINYFENTGSAASPTYSEVTGTSNPFYNGSVGGFSSIKLADLDDDGDADALVGDSNGNISYFLNTDNPVAFGPGGITSNIELWLKADTGVTESSNVVSAWADQSGNANNATQGTSSYQPTYESNALNYNPGILFAEDFLDTSLDIGASSVPDVSIVFVYTPSTDPAGALWGISNGDWNRCLWDDATWNNSVCTGSSSSTDNITNLFVSGQANITTVAFDEDASNGSSVYVNGVLQRQFTADHGSLTANNFDIGTWGGGAGATGKFQGRVFEGFVYSSLFSSQELNQVETYLGIKYGISLSHDYEASDATTLWDATTNATYHNDVAGIGRDDDSVLNQKQSTSESGGIVEIGLGALAADNASNANTFSSDLAFMVWGHDNASTAVATAYSGTSTNTRMARIWKVEETGTVGTVEIQIPDSYGATYLIVSSNSSLTSPTETSLTDNGDGTMSTTVNFSDGQFFTFGQNSVAPGGVTGNLELWLKADAGVTESSNDVSAWADQSGNGNDASQGTTSLQPDYQSVDANYNPGIQFDGADDNLSTSFSINAGTFPDISIITVYQSLADAAGAPWGEDDGSWDRYIWDTSLPDDAEIGAGTTWQTTTGLFVTNSPMIGTIEYDEDATNGTSVFADGSLLTQFTSDQAPESSSSFSIGHIGSGAQDYNGHIYELIVHSQLMTTAERNRIESYLAIKYGITLGHDYLASDATTLWDATVNSTYHNDVAGIGRDDVSALNQKQSTSQSGGIVEIGLGALAVDNATNANTFSTDLDFMLWGHDNASASIATSFSGTNVFTRMARVWKVEETGTVGSVEIQIPDSYDATYLIVSANSALTSPTEVALTDNGDGTRSTTVNFTDGQFFSFGVGESPGGIFADIELWLKADAGVTESSGDVSAWTDQSGSGNDATQGTANRQPAYVSSGLNYNPVINFDGNLAGDGSGDDLQSSAGYYDQLVCAVFSPDGDITPKNPTVYTTGQQVIGVDANGNVSEDGFDVAGLFIGDGTNAADSELIVLRGDTDDGGTTYTASYENISEVLTGGEPLLVCFTENATNDGKELYQNGVSLTVSEYNTYESISNKPYRIGNDWNTFNSPTDGDSQRGSGSNWFNGDVAEVVLYSQVLSSSDREQVEAYLALKYGITLGHDYTASDATTLWNATTNATYHNDVFGIGRDDASALYQKQSGASIVTVALGTLAADNASNANTISTDLTFLVMGHNAGALTESAVTVGAYTADQLGRKWFAKETNDTGSTLEFKFDLTGLTVSGTTAAEFKLILDTDTDPSNGTRQIISAASFASDVVTFSNVDVEDNDYLILLTDYDLAPVGPPVTDGAGADGVLGQPDLDSATGNNGGVSSTALNGPTYFAMGPTGKVFVSDSKNHRVLRWSSVNAAMNGSAAEAVFGQADFTSNTANRGGAVAANTLFDPSGLFVTSTDALFISDSQNNRILRFDNAESASTGAAADGVLGQADYVSYEENRRQNVAANSLRWPKDLYVDSGGRLWAVDWLNHRVLRYDSATSKADGADADGVIGQPNFTSREVEWQNQTDGNSLVYPAGVYVDGAGRLWVNDAGNSRVLRFDAAASKADGADADGVLGQPDYTSWRVNQGGVKAANTLHWPDAGIDGDNQGGIWVADRWGDRVLWYEDAATKSDGADADGVLGQPDFVSSHGTVDDDSFNGAHDVFIDTSSDQIWVVDNAHNRVLRFDATAASLSKLPDGPEFEEVEIPDVFALYQNYPNPFNPSTTIGFDLPESVHVKISVFDMLGRPVKTLVHEVMPAGKHEVQFEASDLASGIYFYQMQAAEEVHLKKMLLLK